MGLSVSGVWCYVGGPLVLLIVFAVTVSCGALGAELGDTGE